MLNEYYPVFQFKLLANPTNTRRGLLIGFEPAVQSFLKLNIVQMIYI